MLQINMDKSGVVQTTGGNRLVVVVDATNRSEADSAAAKQLAVKTAADHGFGNGGMCELPVVVPLDAKTNDVFANESDMFAPGSSIGGYRATFQFMNRQ